MNINMLKVDVGVCVSHPRGESGYRSRNGGNESSSSSSSKRRRQSNAAVVVRRRST